MKTIRYVLFISALLWGLSCRSKQEDEPKEPEIPVVVTPPEEPEEEKKIELPTQSSAYKYLSRLNRLRCPSGKISTYDDEFAWEKDDIVGTWKLLLDFNYFTGDTVDYSCKSVIYSFKADGTVTVSSNVKEIQDGQFGYDYYSDPFCPVCIPPFSPRPNLVIGSDNAYCEVVCSWLTEYFYQYAVHDPKNDTDMNEDTLRLRSDVKRIYYKIN